MTTDGSVWDVKFEASSSVDLLASDNIVASYRPQRSWGKVSEAWVKNSVHRVGSATNPPLGRPPWPVHAGRYGQQAGGTHPTGMHTC